MEAEQEWLLGGGVVGDDLEGVVAEQVGAVAGRVDLGVVVPEVGGAVGADMGVVVEAAAAEAVEMVVAGLERAEVGQVAEVPLADEGGAVAGLLEQGGQGREARREADILSGGARDRLFEADGETELIAPGDDGGARGGADG